MKNTYFQLRNLIGQTVTAMVQITMCYSLLLNVDFKVRKLGLLHKIREIYTSRQSPEGPILVMDDQDL